MAAFSGGGLGGELVQPRGDLLVVRGFAGVQAAESFAVAGELESAAPSASPGMRRSSGLQVVIPRVPASRSGAGADRRLRRLVIVRQELAAGR